MHLCEHDSDYVIYEHQCPLCDAEEACVEVIQERDDLTMGSEEMMKIINEQNKDIINLTNKVTNLTKIIDDGEEIVRQLENRIHQLEIQL